MSPGLATGEAYMHGDLEVQEPLDQLIRFSSDNSDAYGKLSNIKPLQALKSYKRNNRSNQKRHIAHHYDIGNDFYKLWLDTSMTYSCAYFETPDATLDDAIQSWGSDFQLSVLTSGPIPANPSELLGFDRMRKLVDEFVSRYDLVIFDSPPVMLVTDAGRLIRVPADQVRITGRAAMGGTLFRVDSNEKVTSVFPIVDDGSGDEAEPPADPAGGSAARHAPRRTDRLLWVRPPAAVWQGDLVAPPEIARSRGQ